MLMETTMNTKVWILAIATITAACSAEPDGDDPVIIMLDDETDERADAAQQPAADMGVTEEREDAGAWDASVEEPDLGAMEPDLPPVVSGNVCQAKDAPVQLVNTCMFQWSSCDDGRTYAFECNIQNVAGNVFSLCNCFENGVMDEADKIVDICGASDWAEVEAIVNEQCGWDLR